MSVRPAAAVAGNPGWAAGLLIFGVAVLSLQDSLIKLVADQTSFWQFQGLRSAINLMLLCIIANAGAGLATLRPKNSAAVAVRSAFLTICMFCFFSGAPFLSFAHMGTGLYTFPMWVTLLSGAVLGERVGRWRLAAVAVSATGAALILRPWDEAFHAAQVLPMLAGFFYACNVLTLRRWCVGENTLALAFAVGIAFLVSGLAGIAVLSLWPPTPALQDAMPFVAIGWPELTVLVLAFSGFASVCNLTGNICLTRAYQAAEPSWLAPFDYSYLGFVVFWGALLFDDPLDGLTLTGMGLIAVAGIATALRETRRRPRTPRRGPIR